MTTQAVQYTSSGEIARICIDNPPVNAIGHSVRAGLVAALAQFAEDTSARIAVLYCAGRSFVAGADIREFGKPLRAPFLPDVIAMLEAQEKPVLAVLHGTALGGGFELALGAHYRIGLASVKLGLPETTLGVIPGAGGTQRLPRLIGMNPALEIITSARQIGADEARDLGILDAIVAADSSPLVAGLDMATKLLKQGAKPRRISEMAPPALDMTAISDLRSQVEARYKGQIAQVTAIDAAREGAGKPFDAGMRHERALFLQLMDSPQRAALIHAFLAERKVAQLPELDGVAPRPTDRVGIVGGGRMGSGIAVAALLAGCDVTLIERDADSAEAARNGIADILGDSVSRGKLSAEARADILSRRFRAADRYAALAACDLVIEAVFEEMSAKQAVFTELDRHCKSGAILATNTSYLDISEIAAVTQRPADVLGLHFFSPAHVMRLLEIVVPEATSAECVATGFAFGKRLRKICVRAGVCDGFIGNRILQAYRASADRMVLMGASPYDVDRAINGFGFPMGPYAMQDLAGLDIGFFTRQRKAATRDPQDFVPKWGDVMHEKGWLGRKSNQGYYSYQSGNAAGRPSAEVEHIIAAERAERGVTPREFTPAEIVARYMAAMVNEAARVVGEGIAKRPLDVDVTLLHGYGFPRWRGGPLHWADAQGLSVLLRQMERFADEDPWFWQPAPLLVELVAAERTFASLNSTG